MRRRARVGNAERRSEYAQRLRGWVERWGQHGAGGLADKLARLEAGEPVVVQGWEVLEGPDGFVTWVLEPDGSLVPVEDIYVDPSAPVLTGLNYRRPDGSLVR